MKRKYYEIAGIIFAALFIFKGTIFAGPVESWQELEVAVRDGKIAQQAASEKLKAIIPELSRELLSSFSFRTSSWVFPLEGRGINSVNKADYQPKAYYGPYGIKGYKFLDGDKHGGHPAYDVFVGKNKAGKIFNALAMQDCVALSIHTGWQHGDKLRGGNYVWLYNPQESKFFYYAHLKDIYVKPGEFVEAGKAIGSVGRTGLLADSKSSPTHTHLMVLDYNNGEMTPFDYYKNISGKRPAYLAGK
jgi:hypothetical protein